MPRRRSKRQARAGAAFGHQGTIRCAECDAPISAARPATGTANHPVTRHVKCQAAYEQRSGGTGRFIDEPLGSREDFIRDRRAWKRDDRA